MSGEPATGTRTGKETNVGSVFVSNYPPYSAWEPGRVDAVERALDAPGDAEAPVGLYVHIPFCRKRCKFCYFKVYTDRNSAQVERYLDALGREAERLAKRRVLEGRSVDFVYIGGGTPSYISSKHLLALGDRLRAALPWGSVREVAFECEPGTLTEKKVEAIKSFGVTRLSLGVEHFDDRVLEENGRAHVSKEIDRAVPWIREAGFDQFNIDLIAGMVADTEATWKETVERAVDLGPDSVTIYQLELPFNTVYSKSVLSGERVPVADWDTKRAWHGWAIERLERAGYEVSSAYTMVRKDAGPSGDSRPRFVYRDSLWRGADLFPLGVSSFGHVSGVHFQNASGWDPYLERIEAGESAADRAFATTPDDRLTREMILQLKLGAIEPAYFERKFGVAILERFAGAFGELESEGFLRVADDAIRLTRDGLLRVDGLLPRFYDPKYVGARYT